MKRLLSLTLAIIMLFGMTMDAAAASPYTKEGEFLKDIGVLKGGTDGDLMLESNLTREQMVVLISRLYGKESEAEGYLSTNTFTDLRPENKYYIPFIIWAKDQGLIQGMTASTFGIGQTVTTQQFQTVLLRALGYTEEAKDWYNVPAFSVEIGLMKGLNFNSDAKLNRGQVAAMLVNALSLIPKGETSPLAVKLRVVSAPETEDTTDTTATEPEDKIILPSLQGSFGYINTIMLTFNKEMNESLITNKTNYTITQKGKELPLPEGTTLMLGKDKMTLTITLPQTIDGVYTIVGLDDSVMALKAIGLMDTEGNRTDPSIIKVEFDDISAGLGKAVDYDKAYPGKKAALTDIRNIKIRFNVPIAAANTEDFSVPGRSVERVVIDGTNIITLRLDDSDETFIEDGYIEIAKDNKIMTALGSPVEGMKLQLIDMVPPALMSDEADVRRGYIEINFSEPLEKDGAGLYRRDLVITRLSDSVVLGKDEYSTALKSTDPSTMQISLKTDARASYYSIKIVDEPQYIRDLEGNLVLSAEAIETDDDI
ncbi:S-layer homology domain-containing protein [Gudongella oleilytica]|uniref:S-layer homology domain-containing protein n=1 Tax=Gudongella oleilytica TaxID=1582259 RepID=UPI000FF8AE67|nr:S-layer homology domain-containing protein [Gudongella oleilytica]